MIRKSISILSFMIACVASISSACANIGGYQVGVQQRFHDQSVVAQSFADWETVFGKPGLHLFAPYSGLSPRSAALILPNIGANGISVSNVTFSFHKKKGPILVGTTDPVLRIEYQGASNNSIFETIRLSQMTVVKTAGDFYVAKYDVIKANGKPIFAQQIAVVAAGEGPFGRGADGVFLVVGFEINGQPPDRFDMQVEQQTATSTLLNGFN